MITTHTGYAKDARNEYKFEVLKEGHIYTLNVEKNGELLQSYWCPDMKAVRRHIERYAGKNYTLEKTNE